MVVESVDVRDFRNLAPCEVALGPGLNLIWGENGAGKTNLLEATYSALAGRSCRTRDDRETIAFGQSLARSEAVVADAGQRRTFLCSVSRADGRRHLVDGSPAGAESAALRPALAVFMPDRLALVKGPPAGRRAHLDGFCAALWPSRGEARRRYSRALAQRNSLLGRIRARPRRDREPRRVGPRARRGRGRADRRSAPRRWSGSPPPSPPAAEALGLPGARPPLPTPQRGDTAAAARRRAGRAPRGGHRARLHRAGARTTTSSPSRPAAAPCAATAPRASSAPRCWRSCSPSARTLLDDGRPAPLMLLDDVSSELDAAHRRLLVEHLADGGGQALITATEPDHLPALGERHEIAIRDGRPLGPAGASELAA